jgi:uncharacterized delta-60 repeat protein
VTVKPRLTAVPIVFLLLLLGAPASADAAGALDPSFGLGGVAISPARGAGELDAVARDRSGRLVTVGTTSFYGFTVQRFLSDGSLDASFGKGGATTTFFSGDARANAIAVQPDGKILAAGGKQFRGANASFALSRYLPDGKPDLSFGKRGRVAAGPSMYGGEALALALQPDGRILAAGYAADTAFGYTGMVMRFKPNGELDESFSHNGFVRLNGGFRSDTELSSVTVLPGGKILAAGRLGGGLALLRANPDGSPDRSFGGGDGLVLTDIGPGKCRCASARRVAVLPDDRILVSGNVEKRAGYPVLARYRANGALDRGFGREGVVRAPSMRFVTVEDMAIAGDGRIVLAGYRWPHQTRPQVAVLRYLPDGRLDPTFGEGGLFSEGLAYESTAEGVLVEPDGRTVIAGRSNPSSAPVREIEGEPGRASVLELGEFMLLRFLP